MFSRSVWRWFIPSAVRLRADRWRRRKAGDDLWRYRRKPASASCGAGSAALGRCSGEQRRLVRRLQRHVVDQNRAGYPCAPPTVLTHSTRHRRRSLTRRARDLGTTARHRPGPGTHRRLPSRSDGPSRSAAASVGRWDILPGQRRVPPYVAHRRFARRLSVPSGRQGKEISLLATFNV